MLSMLLLFVKTTTRVEFDVPALALHLNVSA
jgi:hypothetical protein